MEAMEKMIAVRVSEEQEQRLKKIADMTGWSVSDVIRQLIDGAKVTPPTVTTMRILPKGEPLADAAMV